MSEFFQHYPQINYDISGVKPTKTKTAINIMVKAKLKAFLKMILLIISLIQYQNQSVPI